MTKKKGSKRALLMSVLSILTCMTMLIGSTFAWFTDSVTSSGNKIKSGTLKLDLELLDKESGWASIKESKTPIFNNHLWEPGYTDIKILKVENEGSLALKWYAKFISENPLSNLADVIDVYVCPSATELTYPVDRNLDGYEKVGTVAEFVNSIESTTYGTLKAGETAYLGIALKMQEEANNEYQDLALGAFDIQILASQETYESDSFDDQYDTDATYPQVATGTYNGGDTIVAGDVSVTLPAAAEEGVYSLKVDNLTECTDTTGQTSLSLNIDLLKDGTKVNAEPGVTYAVAIYVDKNINVTDVKHNGESVTGFTYDINTGIVSFHTDSFSPFEINYKPLVAKVGNDAYYTIDEAIANWKNNTTLTLLRDVTLSDVVQLKSTEHHILNLGTSTMTAASGKNAFEIIACGTGSAERYAITIKADATNPGTLDAGKKSVVYYDYSKGGISGDDRPIIKVEGGVFYGSTSAWGTAGFYAMGSAARKCATFNFSGGIFNCSVNGTGKSKLLISGGVFHYPVGSQGDSTAYRLISGGTFKSFGFMTADSNNTKFWIGTTMSVSDVGVYIDKNNYLVVGGPVITEPGDRFESEPKTYNAWSKFLQYSSASTYGLYYEK